MEKKKSLRGIRDLLKKGLTLYLYLCGNNTRFYIKNQVFSLVCATCATYKNIVAQHVAHVFSVEYKPCFVPHVPHVPLLQGMYKEV